MKNLLLILFAFFSLSAYAQVPEPQMQWLKTITGDGDVEVLRSVINTYDGGFILELQAHTAPGLGNIDSFCSYPGYRDIFLKYNADATTLEWTKCFSDVGDSFLIYPYPKPDGEMIVGGDRKSLV